MSPTPEILIVHPDQKLRATLGFLLEDLGFRVRSGDKVPSRTAVVPELVIAELESGDSIQSVLDVRHTYPEPKLIVLVREPTVPQLLSLFGQGVQRCFVEPVKVESILASVRELVPEPAQEREEAVTKTAASAVPVSHPRFEGATGGSNRPFARPQFVMPTAAEAAVPQRYFGLPEQERFMDAVERKLADYKGFRGPLALLGPNKQESERAGRTLAKMAAHRDPVIVEPVNISSIRKAAAEWRNDTVWLVRSPEMIPPADREWLQQLAGQRDPATPRIVLAFATNPPDWLKASDLTAVKLPADSTA
jgi:hypothetical protein